ncbi:MAG: hypothetical protein H6Q33_3209 [Deltaproteobacteria bacterium]|nr:hypothetical protein [Deltaproteobacteria bacterium]
MHSYAILIDGRAVHTPTQDEVINPSTARPLTVIQQLREAFPFEGVVALHHRYEPRDAA